MMRNFFICICVLLTSLNAQAQTPEQRLQPLFNTMAQRLGLMQQVALYKWQQQIPVEDLSRELVILNNTSQKASELGLDAASARVFFQAQMDAAKNIQGNWHSHWQQQKDSALPKAADLVSEVRPKLGQLGNQIMQLLAVNAIFINTLGQTQLCEALIPKLNIERLSAEAKQQICSALHKVKPITSRLDRILASGKIKIATTGDYPPFSHRQTDGSYQGIDIDMAQALAKSLDAEIEWVATSWPTLLADLKNEKFDIAMSGISLKLARAQYGFFSVPYHTGGKTPISLCSQKQRFSDLAKLDNPNTRLVVNPGGTNQKFVQKNIKHAAVTVHNDNTTIFQQLLTGKADVMITDAIEVRWQSKLHPQLCVTMPNQNLSFSEKAYLMPRDIDLKTYVDTWLTQLQKTQQVKSTFNAHLQHQ